MEDEQQLASLVLLLRLPFDDTSDPNGVVGGIDGGGGVGAGNNDQRRVDGSSPLQDALERNDCKLLCFLGRLIRHYVASTDRVPMSASYAYLRLALRISFLRYASPSVAELGGAGSNGSAGSLQQRSKPDGSKINSIDRVQEHEQCLMSSLQAALCTRSSQNLDEVDVEMAWVTQSLLLKLSQLDMQCNGEQKSQLSIMWTQTIDALVTRRKGGMSSSRTAVKTNGSAPPDNLNEERLMVKTIHAILDRDSSSEIKQDNQNWNMQYDISLISCIQSFLQLDSNGIQQPQQTTSLNDCDSQMPLWTKDTLVNMIHWSQQKHSLTSEVFRLVLQYLYLCTLSVANETRQRKMCQFYLASDSCAIDGVEEFFHAAIRSFLFYGLVVLSNEVPTQTGNKAYTHANTEQTANLSDDFSRATSIHGDIYLLCLELWELHGVDWLFMTSLPTGSSTSFLWWFQSQEKSNDEHRLGRTWPLCTLVSLAAGEFRLGLGRWVSIVEDGGGEESAEDCTRLVSEIACCATMVTEAVRLMTTIAEDEGALQTWNPDAILHIRKSLEDALNASVQYFTTILDDTPISHLLLEEGDEVGRTCCMVMGSIAAELEVDHLLAAPSSGGVQNSNPSNEEEKSIPSFAYALREGILFCDSVGERLCSKNAKHDRNASIIEKPYEYHEPLTNLLPCIMSLVTSGSSGKEESMPVIGEQLHLVFEALGRDDCLMQAVSSYLIRTSRHWSEFFEVAEPLSQINDSEVQRTDSMISVLKLCTLIINGFIMMAKVPSQINKVSMFCSKETTGQITFSLDAWKTNLTKISKWPCPTLRRDADVAMNEVSDCLLMLQLQS